MKRERVSRQVGTVVADWLADTHQAIAGQAHATYHEDKPGSYSSGHGGLYGMCAHYRDGKLSRVTLDGACGLSSIERIMRAMGIELQREAAGRKRQLVGFYVTEAAA